MNAWLRLADRRPVMVTLRPAAYHKEVAAHLAKRVQRVRRQGWTFPT